MNYDEFQKWICGTVVPNLTSKSCLVMDNASYHNVISPEDKVPTMSMNKGPMTAWLDKHGIDHSGAKTKKTFLSLSRPVKKVKWKFFN